jgi:hypothetical protein
MSIHHSAPHDPASVVHHTHRRPLETNVQSCKHPHRCSPSFARGITSGKGRLPAGEQQPHVWDVLDAETLAEDLLSEVFLDVWRQAGRFECRSSVSTWLMSIARYKALSARRRRTEAELDEKIAATVADPADGPEVALQEKRLIAGGIRPSRTQSECSSTMMKTSRPQALSISATQSSRLYFSSRPLCRIHSSPRPQLRGYGLDWHE